MDALEMLRADHDTVRELFSQFNEAKESGDSGRMETLRQEIFHELHVHTAIEEEVFYPEAEAVGGEVEEIVKEGEEEHHVVDMLMEEINGLRPNDDTFAAKMSVLIENVSHHADEEESELFPQLREAFGHEKLEEMGTKLEEAKQRRERTLAGQERTRDELYDAAKAQDVPGRSNMTKDELADAVDPD